MESNGSNIQHNNENRQCRIIIKFNDCIEIPPWDREESNDFMSCSGFLPLLPGLLVSRLFNSLQPENIIELVRKARNSDAAFHPPNFCNYFQINNCPVQQANDLREFLLAQEQIEFAYTEITPESSPSIALINDPLSGSQHYLKPAPIGIDAQYAWNFLGGDGKGSVAFINIEQGWLPEHEDVPYHTIPLSGFNHNKFKEHGIASMGIISMRNNSTGGIGIASKAKATFVSPWRPDGFFNWADAIMTATAHLNFGDVLLIEAQSFDSVDCLNAWPVEIHEANFQAIRLATALGINVIEPAGNGNGFIGKNLNSFKDPTGKMVLNRNEKDFRDSGATVIAAASSTLPHTKISSSNYGSRVDCFAWGENIVTAGSFPRSSGKSIHSYTRNFCGTSGASAIIAGAVISLQGIYESAFHSRLCPREMRNIISQPKYGTPTASNQSGQPIGVMPDLKKIIDLELKLATENELKFVPENKQPRKILPMAE